MIDPVTLAVLNGRLEQIADEMDATLFRSAFNPIIAEAHDASHGIYDPVITVDFGRDARNKLDAAGADVTYRESPMPHTIDPDYIDELRGWLKARF